MSVTTALQASNIYFAYIELFNITYRSSPGFEVLSLACPLVLFPLPQLIAQSVMLESYTQPILGNAPCCLVKSLVPPVTAEEVEDEEAEEETFQAYGLSGK